MLISMGGAAFSCRRAADERPVAALSSSAEMEGRFEGVTDARGRGLMCAFDLPDTEARNGVVKAAYADGAIMLGCGPRTIRFRPALTVSEADLDEGLAILERSLERVLEG